MTLERPARRLASGEGEAPQPLAAFRGAAAYVLLADPGAGKTTSFREEARAAGGCLVTARDFVSLDLCRHPEWGRVPLFVDALDEVRAGRGDSRRPFDLVCERLDTLQPPAFRLSCNEADWSGDRDRSRLARVAAAGEVTALRLEPLSPEQIEARLAAAPEPSNLPDGLLALLGNPLNLNLLLRAVRRTGEWPRNRAALFEGACESLVTEPDGEHRIPEGRRVSVPAVLDAAGLVSAVLLLADEPGTRLPGRASADGASVFDLVGDRAASATVAALGSQLFSANEIGRVSPAHPQITAFLAARYLTKRIESAEETLSIERALALLAPDRGAPPSPLRGLSAWLAALCPAARPRLIRMDPEAVLRYGDAAALSAEEIVLLLARLGRTHEHGDGPGPPGRARAPIAPEVEHSLVARLGGPSRTGRHTPDLEFVLPGMAMAGLFSESALVAAAEAASIESPGIRTRRAALDYLIAADRAGKTGAGRLRRLLEATTAGEAADPDQELRGTLLRALYPGRIAPNDLWKYFEAPRLLVSGRGRRFWESVGSDCPESDLPAHLDTLAASRHEFRQRFLAWELLEVPLRLLARALSGLGGEMEATRLYRWLRLGLADWRGPYSTEPLPAREADGVRRWLDDHPDIQKAVIRHAMQTEDLRGRPAIARDVHELVYRAAAPDDLGEWHLREAAAAEDLRVAERHLIAYRSELFRRPYADRGTLEQARAALGDRPSLLDRLAAFGRSDLPDGYLEERQRLRPYESPRPDGNTGLREAVWRERAALHENRASPDLMHRLARTCFDPLPGATHTERRRLSDAMAGDRTLFDAALAGLRGAPHRADLPDATSIARGSANGGGGGGSHPLGLAVLAGLSEALAEGDAPEDEDRLRSAVAFSFVLPANHSEPWFQRLLETHPGLVAEELTRTARPRLAAGAPRLAGFSLAFDAAYSRVAALASIPLLRSFPPRAPASGLPLLNELLWSALRHAPAGALEEVVAGKTANRSALRMQRVCWLAAGIALAPGRFLPLLDEEIRGDDARRRALLDFFSPPEDPDFLTRPLQTGALSFLVRTFGPQAVPRTTFHEARLPGEGAALVARLIRRLGEVATPEAGAALMGLAGDPDLAPWSNALRRARERHRVSTRDTGAPAPTAREVVEILQNGAPASPADLREVVAERLDRIAAGMRTTNGTPRRMFWTVSPGQPKSEGDCRDALLPVLGRLLPDTCEARPEGRRERESQGDIRVSAGVISIPVELRRADRRIWWTAPGERPLARYANDPATGGFGIYLALWHGAEYAPRDPETGRRFADAAALERALREGLDGEERRRVAVRVLDVSPPGVG